MPSITLPIGQLRLSPFNVRTNVEDATATSALEKSIVAHGLLLPLVCHPLKGNRRGLPTYGVHAGGRRYRAISALVDRGELPADWPVDVVIRDGSDAELIEQSTAENMLRRELRDYEVYAAIARAHRKGDTAEHIARTLGQDPSWVGQAIRLGNLAEPVFKALEAGSISADQARAFAATEDHALQLSTFEAFGHLTAHLRTPAQIRSLMRVGDAEDARLLRFVTAEAYRAAGGRFELDLFSHDAEQRGRVQDPGLLREIVAKSLEALRTDVRTRSQRRDLQFVAQAPKNDFGTDWSLQVHPAETRDHIELPDGQIVAHIAITDSDTPDVTYWWASRSAKHGNRAASSPSRAKPAPVAAGAAIGHQYDSARRDADASIRQESGLSQDAVQIFRYLRREILRAQMISEARSGRGDAARDYLVWSQLRQALGEAFRGDRAALIGARGISGESSVGMGDAWTRARPHIDATEARAHWNRATAELQAQPFMTLQPLDEAFRAYRSADDALKDLATAVVAGISLERSLNADGYRLAVHDALAADLGADRAQAIRHWWSPTAALLGELPKAQLLAIAEPFAGADAARAWAKLKVGDLIGKLERLLSGAKPVLAPTMALAEAAPQWVHPLLRFGPDDPDDREGRRRARAGGSGVKAPSGELVNDLGRKITSNLQEQLQRELGLAQHVLDPGDLAILFSRVAAGVSGGVAATIVQLRKDAVDAEELYDAVVDGIHSEVQRLKPAYLRIVNELEAVGPSPTAVA